jgi:hypothetical protein
MPVVDERVKKGNLLPDTLPLTRRNEDDSAEASQPRRRLIYNTNEKDIISYALRRSLNFSH